ncbi:MAG TPA: nucleoside triphosphate pyrophosphohydrolase [Anaerolineales bacterium]|nr:nucleoside triphosphate pyrophosphohydrolase [Anaerolineales bacterium]
MQGIIILGLGPGSPSQLTQEAWEVLNNADEIWLRTDQHPTIDAFPSSIKKIHSFDYLYEQSDSFDDVYSKIISKIIELGTSEMGVIYSVPGDPFIAEATSPEIARQAKELGIDLRIVNGLSFLEPTFSALGLDPFPQITLMDAMELSQLILPSFPVDKPVLIAQIYSKMIAAEVKTTLNSFYPDDHKVFLIHAAGTEKEVIENIPLYTMDRSKNIGLMTNLFVPPMDQFKSFEALQEVIARLRAPDGCPWDRAQTHQTLSRHLLEETYEVIEAMESDESGHMAEEFGDLLLQIILNAQIGSEEGEFNILNVITDIHDKLIRRHPHVFNNQKIDDIPGVLENWEKIKTSERIEENNIQGLLSGVPSMLPALIQAQEYQERAARIGFDWRNIDGVIDKIIEEVKEIKDSRNMDELAGEIGDLVFSLVNYSRWNDIDAEQALRKTNKKFKDRFSYVERITGEKGKSLSEMSMEEIEEIWQESKNVFPG